MLLKFIVLLPLVTLTIITIIAWSRALRPQAMAGINDGIMAYQQAVARQEFRRTVQQTRQCPQCGIYVPMHGGCDACRRA